MVAEELKIIIRAETQKAVRELQKVDKQMGKSEKSVSSFAKMAKSAAGMAGVVVAVRQVVKVMGDMTDAYAVQEKAEARLAQVIRSTGGAAGYTADELKAMASGLQKVTTYGDEVIIGAQSMLLTFTKVGRDVIPQATEAILNMATAMDQDLRSVTVQVGKALNDPIQGITALGRAGVQFTDDQKDLIKSLVETNDLAAAQEVILAELETQFGGMARAVADTATGAMVQFKNSMGDIKEVGGKLISQFLKPFAEGLERVTDALMNAINFGPAMDAVSTLMAESIALIEKRSGNLFARDYEQIRATLEAAEAFIETYGSQMSKAQKRVYENNIRNLRAMASQIEGAYDSMKTSERELTELQAKRREALVALAEFEQAALDPLQIQLDRAIEMNAEWYALYLTAKDVGGAEYAEPLLAMTRYWLEQQKLIITELEAAKGLIEDIAEDSGATAEYFADIARDTSTAADNIFDMALPLSGLEKAVEGGLLPAVQDTTAAVWDLDVATVEAGEVAGGVAKGWEEVLPPVQAVNDALETMIPTVEAVVEELEHIKSIYGKGDDVTTGKLEKKAKLEAIAAAHAAEAFDTWGAVQSVMAAINQETADWNSIVQDTTEILLNTLLPGLGNVFTAVGGILERFTTWFNKLIDPEFMTLDEMAKLNEELVEAKENAEEMEHAFSDTGEGFGEMVDSMAQDLDDVLRKIGQVYDEEVWLLQHLLDKGMIGVEEYLRELAKFQAARDAAVGGAGGGGNIVSSTNVLPTMPLLSAASVPAGGPSYSVIITAPTGNAEDIARTVKRGIKTLDRRRR